MYGGLNQEPGTDDQDLIKRLSLLHAILFTCSFPSAVITCFNPFGKVFECLRMGYHINKIWTHIKKCLLITVVCSLPWCYANTVMKYPCKLKLMEFMHTAAAHRNPRSNVEQVELGEVDCASEDLLRSNWSLLVVPGAAVVGFCCLLLSYMLCSLGASARKQFKVMLVPFVGRQIEVLKYRRSEADFWFVTTLWMCMLLAFAAIVIFEHDPVGIVVGYACGEIFLRASAILLRPPDELIQISTGAMFEQNFFVKRFASSALSTQFVTKREVDAVMCMPRLGALVELMDRLHQGDKVDSASVCSIANGELKDLLEIDTSALEPWVNHGLLRETCGTWYLSNMSLTSWTKCIVVSIYLVDEHRTITLDLGGNTRTLQRISTD